MPNTLPVNTEYLFELSSSLSNIFFNAIVSDNCIYKAGSFTIETRFEVQWLVLILELKEFTLYNIIATKQLFTHFVIWKVGLFVEKIKENKNLFGLDGCLLQSLNLHLANILKVFKVRRFPYYFPYVGKHVWITRIIWSYKWWNVVIFQFFTSKSCLGNCESFFLRDISFSTVIFEYFCVFKFVLSSLSFMYLIFLFSTIIQMRLTRQNGIFLKQGFRWLER